MKYQDAIELTQMLARTCKIQGLLAQTWGSHSLSSEGPVVPENMEGAIGPKRELTQYARDRQLDTYSQRILPGLLGRCDPYFVDRGLVEVVERMCGSLPDETRLHPALFPSAYGCLFYETPVAMPMRRLADDPNKPNLPTHEPAPMSGFAWEVSGEGAVLIMFYSWAADTSVPSWLNGVYVGNMPLAVSPWQFSTSTLGSHIALHTTAIRNNPNEDDTNNARRYAISARACVATLLLMDQTLTLRSPTPVDRATRKRAERAGWTRDTNVQVVTLRRVEYTRTDHEARDVEWSCRWIVREHWRTLNRGEADERTVFIPAYVKGPQDKPLKIPSARVWAVVR